MDVFISWSEEKSHQVANKLVAWLPRIFDSVKPWVSDYIGVGQAWLPVLFQQLNETSVGILCLTAENLKSTWIHFEAGAVFKSVRKEALVIPYLIGIERQQLGSPLKHIKAVRADKEGTRSLLATLNGALPAEQRVSDSILNDRFKRFWKDLNRELNRAIPVSEKPPTDRQLLEDMSAQLGSLLLTWKPAQRASAQNKSEAWSSLMLLLESMAREARKLGLSARDMGLHEMRSKFECLFRRWDLMYPSDAEEFRITLWWMGQRGSKEDLELIERIRKAPPFPGKHVSDLVESTLAQMRKRLSEGR